MCNCRETRRELAAAVRAGSVVPVIKIAARGVKDMAAHARKSVTRPKLIKPAIRRR